MINNTDALYDKYFDNYNLGFVISRSEEPEKPIAPKSLAMDKAMGRDTLGGGDIKLIAVCGLYLGFIGTLFTLMIACFAGLAFNVIANKSSDKGSAFPFGPWIAAGAAIMLMAGGSLIGWYSSLLS